jgi:hypothetical protein
VIEKLPTVAPIAIVVIVIPAMAAEGNRDAVVGDDGRAVVVIMMIMVMVGVIFHYADFAVARTMVVAVVGLSRRGEGKSASGKGANNGRAE